MREPLTSNSGEDLDKVLEEICSAEQLVIQRSEVEAVVTRYAEVAVCLKSDDLETAIKIQQRIEEITSDFFV